MKPEAYDPSALVEEYAATLTAALRTLAPADREHIINLLNTQTVKFRLVIEGLPTRVHGYIVGGPYTEPRELFELIPREAAAH